MAWYPGKAIKDVVDSLGSNNTVYVATIVENEDGEVIEFIVTENGKVLEDHKYFFESLTEAAHKFLKVPKSKNFYVGHTYKYGGYAPGILDDD